MSFFLRLSRRDVIHSLDIAYIDLGEQGDDKPIRIELRSGGPMKVPRELEERLLRALADGVTCRLETDPDALSDTCPIWELLPSED